MIMRNVKAAFELFMDAQFRANMKLLHRRLRLNPRYHMSSALRCCLNATKHERLIRHDGKFIVNSFLPPINTRAYESVILGVAGEGEQFYEDHAGGARAAPVSVYIAATARCNYSCWHCSASQMTKGQSADLPIEDLIRIVKDAQDLGVGIIGFTGGEPLLRRDLEEAVAAIDERSASLLFTNGCALTRERALSLKAAGLFGVGVSLDGADEGAHDEKRGWAGARRAAVSAIQYAKEAGLYTMGQTVCDKAMLRTGEIHRTALFLKELGVHELRILEPIPCGMLAKDRDALLSPAEKEELVRLHILFNHDRRYPKTSVFPYVESDDQFGCGAGVQHSYIDAAGNFRPCDFIGDSYGNVLKEPMKDVWARMHQSCGGPKCGCLAKMGGKGAVQNKIPKYYRLLNGERE